MSYNQNAGYGNARLAQLTAPQTTGKTFLVSKSTQPNADALWQLFTPDTEWVSRIFPTITAALAQCVANRGDVIYVAPWYTETISAAGWLTISKAWVSIIGLGTGSLRPTITSDTSNLTTTLVSAANVTISNFIFIANFLNIATCIALTTATDFEVSNCSFRDTSSILNFKTCVQTNTTSNNADGLAFLRNRANLLATASTTTPIKMLGTNTRIRIQDNYIVKVAESNVSCLLAQATTKVVTSLDMARNIIYSAATDSATGGFLITTDATTNTGMVYDNYVRGLDVAAAILVTAWCNYWTFNNLYTGDVDTSGFVLPAIGTDA